MNYPLPQAKVRENEWCVLIWDQCGLSVNANWAERGGGGDGIFILGQVGFWGRGGEGREGGGHFRVSPWLAPAYLLRHPKNVSGEEGWGEWVKGIWSQAKDLCHATLH